MKRKVFSLLVLCLFAFLGLANAQTTGSVNANPNPIDLGYRPLGAWMRPFEVQLTTTGAAQEIINMEVEGNSDFFLLDADIPGSVSSSSPYEFTVNHGEATPGNVNGQLVVMTPTRKAYIFQMQAVAYEPIAADVVETAPTITLPFTANVGANIYDNYLLPGSEPDGKDVIYKMNVANDILFNAEVTGENGKVALYQEDFHGQPGPGANNNYTGQVIGGGGGPFETVVGEPTIAIGYLPGYYYYNYSFSYQLFHADELLEAGVMPGEFNSISFFSQSDSEKLMKNVTIWMTNTSATEAPTTTPIVNSLWTCVYNTSDHQEVNGWNEFEFTTPFEWDGTSNVAMMFQMNNGSWASGVYWHAYPVGFNASTYNYQDSSPYNVTGNSYSQGSTTTYRSYRNVVMIKGNGRSSEPARGIANMTLTPGIYYVAASSTSDQFTVNLNKTTLPKPEPAFDPYPADGDVNIMSPVTFTWNLGEYTTAYRMILGTTYPPQDVVVDWTNDLANNITLELSNNQQYFWRIDEKNFSGETEGAIWGFSTELNVPQGLAAEDMKIFEGETLHLTWTPVEDRSYRGYNVYQDGVKINDEIVTTTEYTVNGLTYNMDGYIFNVQAVYDAGLSNLSPDCQVLVSGNGTISGHVYEIDGHTGIVNANVILYGTDEFNDPVEYTATTAAGGLYTVDVKAGNYTDGYAMKDGYQPATLESAAAVTYNNTTNNVNFVLRESLNPVNEVIAEEMSEDQVKVYWSLNAISEPIEDFETGDFSQFDWINDATYPWTVVTTSPYEGDYCIKSGNEGINSSTSAIEVSVEISRDGLMSFYNKVSSESNYDKGYFYIDGTEKFNTSGSHDWNKKEYPITAGVHTFKWAYTKDSSLGSYDDCFYIDFISFIHDAEPVEPGWIGYDNDAPNEDAIGTNGGNFSWGVMFPAGSYAGNAVTKVKAFDYMAMTGSVTIYNDGATAPANAVGTQDVSFSGSEDWVEFELTSPAIIDPTKNLWIIFYNGSGATYPAACCADQGDPNGRWVSIDGIEWMDLADAGLYYTFQIRAFVADAKGEVQEITVNNPHSGGTLAAAGVAKGHGDRAFHHYNIYRALASDETGENAELLASTNDTAYFDNKWGDLAPGVYKWGVSRYYQGNRGNRDEVYDFENSTLQGWTTIDGGTPSGYGWQLVSNKLGTGYGHNSSIDAVMSQSYDNNYGVIYPDNYLISPQRTLGGSITFYACAQDANYAAEHFGVAVSTSGASASDFTMLQEWTIGSKGERYEGPRGTRDQSPWIAYTVDLSAYAGQTGYVAIRHFNCSDQFYLLVDDIELAGGGGDDPTPTPGAGIIGVEIFRDGEWIAEVPANTTTYTDIAPGTVEEYELRVVYNGNTEDYTYYTMSCPQVAIPQEFVCLAPENLTGSYEYLAADNFGALLNWTYSGEISANMYQYDQGTNSDAIGLGGGQFRWGIMLPAGSYEGAMVSKVEVYDYQPMTGTLTLFAGGSNAPQTQIATMDIQFNGIENYTEFVFDEPVSVDPTQNLWVIFDNASGAAYPAACGNYASNDPNGRWVELEGAWYDMLTVGITDPVCFNIHTYITDGTSFNIYRDGELIANVPATDAELQTYFDEVAIGNYQYQVTAVSPTCESDFALTPDLSQNYVTVNVTSVVENVESRIYPNPTTGNVMIEAADMNHITVVNSLGQVLYDADVYGDQMTMNLGQFKAGVYMIRIVTESGVSVNRVTVTK